MLLHYLYYIAVDTGGPGKIWFSRKLGPKMARFPKIALLNDPKNFQTKISNAQNRSICKVIYLKSIFQHLFEILPTTGWSKASLRKFFDEKNQQQKKSNRPIRKVI